MTKQYRVDNILRNKLKKNARKSSRLWKLHIPIRILLWIGITVLPLYTAIAYQKAHPEEGDMWFFAALAVLCFSSMTLIIYYLIMLIYFVGAGLRNKMDETLVLYDDRIYNLYHPYISDRKCNYVEYDIFFDEINKLEYNVRHDFLKIYAPVHIRFHDNYALNIVTKAGVLKEREKAFRILYLYYENFEDLLDEIEKRSGVQIVKVDYLDKNTKEASYKKIDEKEEEIIK